jgi:excisionase family DNA binding protein
MSDEERTQEEKLLDSREAAELLNVSVRTLSRMTSPRGPIKAFRCGQVLRFRREDLRAFIDANVA